MKVDVGNADNMRSIFYDNYLIPQLIEIKSILRNDSDVVAIIDGEVGSGKSTLAQQVALYIDPNFSLNQLCFDGDTFKEAIIKSKRFQCVVFDEALVGFNIRRTMSSINTTLVAMMQEIRQKNLLILLCLPSVHDLDRSISIHRSMFLMNTYSKGKRKGMFKFWGRSRKKRLMANPKAKKTYSYPMMPNFRGRFMKGYCVDELQYRALKDRVLKKYMPDQQTKLVPLTPETAEAKVWQKMVDNGMKIVDVSRLVDMPYKTVQKRLYRLKHSLETGEQDTDIKELPTAGEPPHIIEGG